MWLRRKTDRTLPDPGAVRLVTEVEAFFSGGYEDLCFDNSDAIPMWSRLNSCAHGDLGMLRGARDSIISKDTELWERTWRRARRLFASELLELVHEDAELLSQVQRRSLIPLELDLIAAEAAGTLTPAELVCSFRAALRSNAP